MVTTTPGNSPPSAIRPAVSARRRTTRSTTPATAPTRATRPARATASCPTARTPTPTTPTETCSTRTQISSASSNQYETVYSWDYRNRLTEITYENNADQVTETIQYRYDCFDRRIYQHVDYPGNPSADATLWFVYDGQQMVLALNSGGTVAERYLPGPAVDQVLAVESGAGVVSWLLADNHGTVLDVVQYIGGDDDARRSPGLRRLRADDLRVRAEPESGHRLRRPILGRLRGLVLLPGPLVQSLDRPLPERRPHGLFRRRRESLPLRVQRPGELRRSDGEQIAGARTPMLAAANPPYHNGWFEWGWPSWSDYWTYLCHPSKQDKDIIAGQVVCLGVSAAALGTAGGLAAAGAIAGNAANAAIGAGAKQIVLRYGTKAAAMAAFQQLHDIYDALPVRVGCRVAGPPCA